MVLTLLLALACGAAGTLFEVTWFRVLTPVLGNSAYSFAAVLAAFMAGFSLGGFLIGRLADRVKNPWRTLAGVALLTALAAWWISPATCSAAVSFTMGLEPGSPALHAIRFAFSFLILLIPSLCIGGMLPLLVRLFIGTSLKEGRIGILYGIYTFGSVGGILFAGFYTIEVHGLAVTTTIAALLLLTVAVVSMLYSFGRQVAAAPDAPSTASDTSHVRIALATVTVSGFSLIACEVLWSRILYFLLGNDSHSGIYMLAVLLTGMGIGGLVYGRYISRSKNRLFWLGLLHGTFALLVVVLSQAACAWFTAKGVIVLKIFDDPITNLTANRVVHGIVVVFLPGFICGAAFPLATEIIAAQRGRPGKSMGDASALSALGSVCGALAPLILMHAGLGYAMTLLVVISTNLAVSAALLMKAGKLVPLILPIMTVIVAIVLPQDLLRRMVSRAQDHAEHAFFHESPTACVSVFKDRINDTKRLYVNDVSEVPTNAASLHCFKLLGNLPLLVHGDPENVLMITFGGGIASGAAASHDFARMDVVDIESGVFQAAEHFADENKKVYEDPRVHTWIEDGRNFLLNSDEAFDVIISDSTHPRSGDSWILYTVEFYTLCRDRLRPGGVMTQWLPIHSLKLETYGSILKTFRQAFPHASLWYTKDYTILLGTLEALSIDVARLERSMAAPRVKNDLGLAFFDDPVELLSTFVMQGEGIEAMTSQYKINTDDLPHTAFPGLELRTDPVIPHSLVRYREPVLRYLTGFPAESRDRLERCAAATDALIVGDIMKAVELNPESGRMQAYAREARDYGEYLVRKLEYYPGDAQLMREAAGALIERGDHARAAGILEAALEIEETAGGWYLLGTSARRAGRARRAEEALTRAVELAPGHWRAWKELGMLQLERGKPKKARTALEKVLELRPDDPKAGEIVNQLQKRGF